MGDKTEHTLIEELHSAMGMYKDEDLGFDEKERVDRNKLKDIDNMYLIN